MQLTREADYAVRVILDLADRAAGAPVRSAEIARRQRIPRAFLTKVVQRLAHRKLVRTYRGTGGGVALARDPRTLTLLDVVEAIEGPIRLNRCLVGPGACPLMRRCPAHPVWRRIQRFVTRELDGTTIASLQRRTEELKHPEGGRLMPRTSKKGVVTALVIVGLVSAGVLAGRPLWHPQTAAHRDHLQHLFGSAAGPASQARPVPMFMDLLMGGPAAAAAARIAAAAVPAMRPEIQSKVSRQGAVTVREYTLEITEQTIDYGGGNRWTVWTYHGTVPGPTLRVKAGEILRVRVVNRHTRVHSFHTHLSYYPIENDGSQANIITGRGSGAMIPPGKEYTYQYSTDRPMVTYYHCHSGDREFPINQHILQGLYGMIIVEDPRAPSVREEVLFMAETTRQRQGSNVPPYIMNGMGVPGGELALEEIYKKDGLQGVVAQLGKTVPFFKMKVGESMRLHVVNIGNIDHSLHIHEIPMISLGVLNGRPWPAQVLPLVGGAADTLQISFRHPGIWLFHCHVVDHADRGMIGVFIVE